MQQIRRLTREGDLQLLAGPAVAAGSRGRWFCRCCILMQNAASRDPRPSRGLWENCARFFGCQRATADQGLVCSIPNSCRLPQADFGLPEAVQRVACFEPLPAAEITSPALARAALNRCGASPNREFGAKAAKFWAGRWAARRLLWGLRLGRFCGIVPHHRANGANTARGRVSGATRCTRWSA